MHWTCQMRTPKPHSGLTKEEKRCLVNFTNRAQTRGINTWLAWVLLQPRLQCLLTAEHISRPKSCQRKQSGYNAGHGAPQTEENCERAALNPGWKLNWGDVTAREGTVARVGTSGRTAARSGLSPSHHYRGRRSTEQRAREETGPTALPLVLAIGLARRRETSLKWATDRRRVTPVSSAAKLILGPLMITSPVTSGRLWQVLIQDHKAFHYPNWIAMHALFCVSNKEHIWFTLKVATQFTHDNTNIKQWTNIQGKRQQTKN